MNQTTKSQPSKSELLFWLNGILKEHNTNLPKVQRIEELGNGTAFCHLINISNPGAIPSSKINNLARFEYEGAANLKLLDSAFAKLKINKKVEVPSFNIQIDKMAKMKVTDNLEMLQWFFKYFQEKQKNSTQGHSKNEESSTILVSHILSQNKKPEKES